MTRPSALSIADSIDPRVGFKAYDIPHADLIAASDLLRHSATVMEELRKVAEEIHGLRPEGTSGHAYSVGLAAYAEAARRVSAAIYRLEKLHG